MDKQTDERKDLQTAIWAEELNLYITEILWLPYVWLKPFQKEKNIITGYNIYQDNAIFLVWERLKGHNLWPHFVPKCNVCHQFLYRFQLGEQNSYYS